MNRIILLLNLGCLLMSAALWSQEPSASSYRRYIADGDLYAMDVAYHPGNGRVYHLLRRDVGFTETAVLQCADTLGSLIWTHHWGADQEILRPRNLRIGSDGMLLITAMHQFDIVLLRIQPDGKLLSMQSLRTLTSLVPRDVVELPYGGWAILGERFMANGGYGAMLIELDTLGQVVRHRVFQQGVYTYLMHLNVENDGSLLLSGSADNRALALRLDPDWNLLWCSESAMPDLSVRGQAWLPTLPDGRTRQLMQIGDHTWLIERDAAGNPLPPRWINHGQSMGVASRDGWHCVVTLSNQLALLNDHHGVQFRQNSGEARIHTRPIILPNASLLTMGWQLEQGHVTSHCRKGAAQYAPGCIGNFTQPLEPPQPMGLTHQHVTPEILTLEVSVLPAQIPYGPGAHAEEVLVCSGVCHGVPAADFSVQTNQLTLSFAALQPQFDVQHQWTITGQGVELFGMQGTWSAPEAGSYEVCLRTRSNCGQSVQCQTVQLGSSSVSAPAGARLQLSPNPAKEQFSLTQLSPGYHQLVVSDRLGRTVYAYQGHLPDTWTIPCAGWPAGAYAVQAISEAGRFSAVLIRH